VQRVKIYYYFIIFRLAREKEREREREREREKERYTVGMKNALVFRIPRNCGNAVLPVSRWSFLANRIAVSLVAAEAKRELNNIRT
jgi:hypothetical protein